MSTPKAPRPRRSVSARQLAANRANAAHSTGPRTSEGKARSSQNARRHGFAAADFGVVRFEDLQAVANLKADLVSVYQPVNSQELFALERMALAQQALLRAACLEAGLFTCCLDEAVDSQGEAFIPMAEALIGDLKVTPGQDHNFALAHGFSRMVQRGNTWTLFLRYQAQAERQYRRAVEEFERLKALRGELPNEPILQGHPEEDSAHSGPPDTNPIEPENAVPTSAGSSAPGSPHLVSSIGSSSSNSRTTQPLGPAPLEIGGLAGTFPAADTLKYG